VVFTKRLPADGDLKLVHTGEVRGTQLAGIVLLGKEYFFGRSFGSTPHFDTPLQGS